MVQSGGGNLGGKRTAAERFYDRMLMDELPTCFRYAGTMVGDAAPAASELFLNGERDNRIYIPPNGFLFGRFLGTAWSTIAKTPAAAQIDFGITNTDNVLAFTAGDPVTSRAITTAGTFTAAVDNTLKALKINFLPLANATVRVSGVLYFSFVASKTQFPNNYRQVN